jgi:hypothetical protein
MRNHLSSMIAKPFRVRLNKLLGAAIAESTPLTLFQLKGAESWQGPRLTKATICGDLWVA